MTRSYRSPARAESAARTRAAIIESARDLLVTEGYVRATVERIAQGAQHIRARHGAAISDDAVRALMSVNPVYLEAALATVRRDHGDIPTYAETVLNLTPEKREAMIDRLVI